MRFGSGRTGLLQDSTGSIIVNQDGQHDDIQMQSLSEGNNINIKTYDNPSCVQLNKLINDFYKLETPDETPGVVEQIIMAVYSIFQLIVNSSYLATNIIMMVSIIE